jgi:hypothetical protein
MTIAAQAQTDQLTLNLGPGRRLNPANPVSPVTIE